MKRVANTSERPVVVPVVVVAVDVQLALVVPTIERGVALYRVSSRSLPPEYSKGLYRIWHRECLKTPYQVASFFEVSACTTLSKAVTVDIQNAWILGSVAESLDSLSHIHLLPF